MFQPLPRLAARQLSRRTRHVFQPRRGYAMEKSEPFDWKDPLRAANNFTEEELQISETAEAYCQERMAPRVLGMLSS